MKKMNKRWLVVGIVVIAIALIAGGYVTWQNHERSSSDNRVSYVVDEDNLSEENSSTEDKTPAEIDEEEHIDAEQIVAKILPDGYATSHGDHYHYYSGHVPANSLFNEDLILDQSIENFSDDNILYEIDNGWIVRKGDDYYVVLDDPNNRQNIRSESEIEAQHHNREHNDDDH